MNAREAAFMNTIARWGKFNLVGAMGVAVQLSALAVFNRWMAGRYLVASAAALELESVSLEVCVFFFLSFHTDLAPSSVARI